MDFAHLIDQCIVAMHEKKLTNKDLSRISQISEATISRTLSSKGQNASAATISAICSALDVCFDGGTYDITASTETIQDVYRARIADLKHSLDEKNRWLRAFFIACAVLVAFILVLFAVDLLNPNVGWFRS